MKHNPAKPRGEGAEVVDSRPGYLQDALFDR
jgi:hypothetical protein